MIIDNIPDTTTLCVLCGNVAPHQHRPDGAGGSTMNSVCKACCQRAAGGLPRHTPSTTTEK